MRRGIYAAGLGLLVGIATLGCAQERDPINRVQPDALKKSFFLGEDLQSTADDPVFLTRGYNVQNSFDQGTLFIGTSTGEDRIRWEVTEGMLIARKAYSLAPGRDNKGVPGGEANGTVVAAYKILTHFDVRRAYNPQTGEEMNVVDENTSDRPWYQREYFRVDWSTNQVANPMDLDTLIGRWFGDPKITPMSYYVNDPNSEEAPFFDEKDGYFDVTNRFWVEPGKFYFDWGTIPACMLIGLTTGSNVHDCNAQEVHVRLSFWKVNSRHDDYEPMENTYAPQDIINNFGGSGDALLVQYGAPIQEYDPQYGYLDKGLHGLVARINIWEQSHTDIECDSNADVLKADGTPGTDGTADQCAGYQGTSWGSQCDLFKRKCTIPYRDRQIKTVGWWVNKEMPDIVQDTLDESGNPVLNELGNPDRGAVEDVVYTWNQLFTASVAWARATECRRTGDGDRGKCYENFFNLKDGKPDKVMVSYGNWLIDDPIDKTPVYTLCHNPVRGYDMHDVCGDTGFKARLGDQRKFFLIDYPMATNAPFGGVTHLGPDPVSGELIGGTSTSVHIGLRAQRFLDMLFVEMGYLTLEELLAGGSAEKYAQLYDVRKQEKALTPEEITRRISLVDKKQLAVSGGLKSTGAGPLPGQVKAFVSAQKSMTTGPSLLGAQALHNDQMMTPLRNAGLDHDLVDSRWLVGLNIDPSSAVDDSVLEQASPLRNMDTAKIEQMRAFMQKRLADAGVCFTPVQDGAGIGQINNAPLVNYFKTKYAGLGSTEEKIEAIKKEVYRETFKGVILHEMGHGVGMRHQFSSSWDSLNYAPQYWQLRTNEGAATVSCGGKPRDTSQPDSCLGPRYFDPHTQDEKGWGEEPHPAIEYYGNTSTMEYQNENFSETLGLGTWDYHMTKAAYFGVLETMDTEVMNRDTQKAMAPKHLSHLADADYTFTPPEPGDPTEQIWTEPFMHSTHYTNVFRLAKPFDPARDCRPASPEEKLVGKWRLIHGKVCQPMPRDHARWADFLSDWNNEVNDANSPDPMLAWHTRADLPNGPNDVVRWPYKIGESYSPAWIHTNMMDAGADPYEIAVNSIAEFNSAYPFRYFRRGNRDASTGGIPSIAAERLFEVLRSYHWSAANRGLYWLSLGAQYYDLFVQSDDWSRPAALSNLEIFRALLSYTLTPQPGDFKLMADNSFGVPLYDATAKPAGDADFTVKIIDGRYIDEAYNTTASAGGSWDFERWWTRAGFYTEKSFSFLTLCDSRPTLATISRDNYLDGREPKLNFRSDMPQAFDRVLGALLAEDWASLAPYVMNTAPGTAAVPIQLNVEDITKPVERPAGAKILYPNVGYLQQLYSAVFSMLYARENTDMTLVHKMRIWVDGVEGDISDAAFPAPKDQLKFYDPGSGFTYIGRRFGNEQIDGRAVERGISSRVLQRANDLVIQAYVVQLDTNNQPVLDETGKPTLVLDADGQPQVKDGARRAQLSRYVGLIDSIRQLGHWLGQGPY
ncbi:MAG: hypothetical protein HY898_08350 [Deltaproteobacteria bacterium]|nr:hypothetical protein [Deltaproteobacteria bacterium]